MHKISGNWEPEPLLQWVKDRRFYLLDPDYKECAQDFALDKEIERIFKTIDEIARKGFDL